MNEITTANTTDMTGERHSAFTRRRNPLRIIALVLALSLATGVASVGAASPAGAANVPARTTVCFQAAPVMFPNMWGGYKNRPVHLDLVWGGKAVHLTTWRTDGRGCISTQLPSGYTWRFRVFHYETSSYWVGQTGWQYMKPGWSYNFGYVRLANYYAPRF